MWLPGLETVEVPASVAPEVALAYEPQIRPAHRCAKLDRARTGPIGAGVIAIDETIACGPGGRKVTVDRAILRDHWRIEHLIGGQGARFVEQVLRPVGKLLPVGSNPALPRIDSD